MKLMKKISFLFFALLFFSFSLPFVKASSLTTSELRVTLLSQSPDPVEPGQIVTLKFKVENLGRESAVDNLVKIIPKFPFTLYGDSAEKNIGKLRAGQTGADAAIVEFKLKVDEKAVEGDTEIELMVQVDQDTWKSYTNNEFLVNIQTQDAVLDITSITFEPEQIAPGDTTQVTFLIKNLADSLLKDVHFKLNFDDDELPLAPYHSSSERIIPQLQSDYQKSLTFNLIADPDASPGLYKLPLTITYNDEKGKSYSLSDILAVIIGGKPKINAYIKKSSVLQPNQEGTLTLEIANVGPIGIKFLEVFLLPSDDYQLITPSDYFYIGDVDSDDTESEEISLFINKNVETLHFPIQLKYYDANNQPYQQNFALEMNLYSSSQLKKFGVLKTSYTWLYLLIVIFAVVGYFFYRHYHKKKKQ